uniref:WD_REPEATS_REGION domain-containing protein n=1 Tax=Trichuris muris TaxID=70415 RepID=A0A5S6QJE0_TRIMR
MVATDAVKAFYNTTFSAVFSADDTHLVCGNRYGYLTVFNVKRLLRNSLNGEDDGYLKPAKFVVCKGPIHAVESVGDLLCCGCRNGSVAVYRWKDVIKRKPKCISVLRSADMPLNPDCSSEVNALTFDSKKPNFVYAAGGDCVVYNWDLERSKVVSQWKEHTDYIHCLATSKSGMILSGGEDGRVKCFDGRSPNSVATMQPYLTSCQRTELGNWIGCISTYEDWMICGGGAGLGLWYLGTFDLVKSMENNGMCWSAASLQNEYFLTGDTTGNAYRWSFAGDFLEKMATSCSSIYDITSTKAEADISVMVCCGSGNAICAYNYFGSKCFKLKSW